MEGLTKEMLPIEEPDLQPLSNLHARDIVWLVAVIMGVKPIASQLVVPLEVREWLQKFCELRRLIHFEDGQSDLYQTWMTVCYDGETAKLSKELKQIHSLFNDVARNPIISRRKRVSNEFVKALTRLEGAMYGYPECCVEFHAEKGPSSRAKAYEEFLKCRRDQSIPIEFWAVAHSPCSSTCQETLELGRKYLDAVAEFSEGLKDHVESRLLLPRFYQTGGGRFIELQPLGYERCREELTVPKEQFEKDAQSRLQEPIEIILCDIPRPFVLVDAPEEPPYKTSFPNPDMIGMMWLAYTPGFGVYMVNAKTGKLALYIISDKWIPKVGEEWRSKSNFRIYKFKKIV
jgi:hypothetical protein